MEIGPGTPTARGPQAVACRVRWQTPARCSLQQAKPPVWNPFRPQKTPARIRHTRGRLRPRFSKTPARILHTRGRLRPNATHESPTQTKTTTTDQSRTTREPALKSPRGRESVTIGHNRVNRPYSQPATRKRHTLMRGHSSDQPRLADSHEQPLQAHRGRESVLIEYNWV